MQDYKINSNYAKALFLLASESNQQDRVAEDMRLVGSVCGENRELKAVFRNPEIKPSKKVAIVTDLFASHVCKVTMAFLSFVVRKKRSVNMQGISNSYMDLYRKDHGVVLTHLTTAVEADSSLQKLASDVVSSYTQKDVELVAQTDPRIVGGLALEFDNRMYDARISTHLAKLRIEFAKNIYESKL